MSKEHIGTWQALVIVFIASACTLVMPGITSYSSAMLPLDLIVSMIRRVLS